MQLTTRAKPAADAQIYPFNDTYAVIICLNHGDFFLNNFASVNAPPSFKWTTLKFIAFVYVKNLRPESDLSVQQRFNFTARNDTL